MQGIAIPQWVNWIAQDQDGAIWGFEAEPHLHDSGWYENEVGRYILLARGQNNPEWKNSLVSITQLNQSPLAKIL